VQDDAPPDRRQPDAEAARVPCSIHLKETNGNGSIPPVMAKEVVAIAKRYAVVRFGSAVFVTGLHAPSLF
jgi:hypothetical protein